MKWNDVAYLVNGSLTAWVTHHKEASTQSLNIGLLGNWN